MRNVGQDCLPRDVSRRIEALPLFAGKKQALRKAVAELRQEPSVLGAALWGSAGRGEPNPRDLDLVVLVPGSDTWTRRRFCDGSSIHIQMRGVERFREMNITRKQTRSERCPAFADLIVLWDDTGTIAVARARARRLRGRGPKPVSQWEAGRLRAEITTLIEGVEARVGDPSAFALFAAHTLSRCMAVHLRLRGAWVPEQKDLLDALELIDEGIATRYRHAISLLGRPAMCVEAIRGLAAEALAPVGGLVGDFEVWYR